MIAVTLKPGWFMRDVNKAVEERKCYKMLRRLSADELRAWHACGVALIAKRSSQAAPEGES